MSRSGTQGGRAGPYWEESTQREFETEAWGKMSYDVPSKLLFMFAKFLWPYLPRWFQESAGFGPTIFSRFADPPPEAYTAGDSVKLKLEVYEGHEIDSPTPRLPVYIIEFLNVPRVIVVEMTSSLYGGAIYRLVIFGIGLFALLGVAGPIVFAAYHPHVGLQIYWAIEQLIVLLLKFDDFRNRSINTEFDAEDILIDWANIS
jgi:hypothetical protein